MGETLIFAIWVASATTFEVALPLHGVYQVREFPNSEAGAEKMFEWANTSAHDKIDRMCVSTPLTETTPVMDFFYRSEARVFLMNPLQVKLHAEKYGVAKITAETAALTCADIFKKNNQAK